MAGDILESVGQRVDTVVVTAQTHVLDAGDLTYVLDVVGNLPNRLRGFTRSYACPISRHWVVVLWVRLARRSRLASSHQSRHSSTNCGTNVTMQMPPLSESCSHGVGDVARVIAQRPSRRVRTSRALG